MFFFFLHKVTLWFSRSQAMFIKWQWFLQGREFKILNLVRSFLDARHSNVWGKTFPSSLERWNLKGRLWKEVGLRVLFGCCQWSVLDAKLKGFLLLFGQEVVQRSSVDRRTLKGSLWLEVILEEARDIKPFWNIVLRKGLIKPPTSLSLYHCNFFHHNHHHRHVTQLKPTLMKVVLFTVFFFFPPFRWFFALVPPPVVAFFCSPQFFLNNFTDECEYFHNPAAQWSLFMFTLFVSWLVS